MLPSVLTRALLIACITLVTLADYAPKGCSFSSGGSSKVTCDFTQWQPPLDEADFGPGDVLSLTVEKVDGTIPSYVSDGDVSVVLFERRTINN